jgi:hypothetical protein
MAVFSDYITTKCRQHLITLEIELDQINEEINEFKRLVRTQRNNLSVIYHPDKNPNPNANEVMQNVSHFYYYISMYNCNNFCNY